MKKKVIIITSVVIILLGGIFVVSKSKSKSNGEVIPLVKVDVVSRQEMITTVEADGKVEFRDKISIYAKNTGKVQRIVSKEGSNINGGDVIIQYDNSSLESLQRQLQEAKLSLKSANIALEALNLPADESQLKQLESQIAQSEKSIEDAKNNILELERKIEQAKTDYEGSKILYEQGAISLTEYNNTLNNLKNYETQKFTSETSLQASEKLLESNRAQYQSAKNKSIDASSRNKIESQKVVVEQAKLKVNQLIKDINKFETSSIAPITGTITKINVVDGESVTEGKLVAEMGNLNDVIIESYIPEYDMEEIAVGQNVKIKSDSVDGEFEGKITKVYPLAESKNISGVEKNVVKIEISIPKEAPLKAGYTTKLTITTKIEPDALVIPIMAYMTETNSDPYVFVVKEDGTLEKRTIKLKSFKNSFASVEGLSEGEKVVSSPNETTKEGMKITPTEQDDNNMNSDSPMTVGSIKVKTIDAL